MSRHQPTADPGKTMEKSPPDASSTQPELRRLLSLVPVLPVLVIDDAELAVPLAKALLDGGLNVLEVTLRTPAALEAISRMATVPGVVVGAGTVTRPADVAAAQAAGARFGVSPGATPRLLEAARDAGLPFLPGVATASEAMAARDAGYDTLKFFPAVPAGGAALLKALGGPLPDLAFCPTGGIDAGNFKTFRALPNVLCVGGSWVAPAEALARRDWAAITRLALETRT